MESKNRGNSIAQGSSNQMQQEGRLISLILILAMLVTGVAIALVMTNVFAIEMIWSVVITASVMGFLFASIYTRC